MNCCIGVSKLLLFMFNFLFLVIGLVLCATGIWLVVDSQSWFQTVAFFAKTPSTFVEIYSGSDLVRAGAWIVLALGAVIFLIAFLGCWGVVSENSCLLITFTILMGIVIVTEVVVVIVFVVLGNRFEEYVSQKFGEKYEGAIGTTEVSMYDAFSFSVDAIMIKYSCCGVNGKSDFDTNGGAKMWLSKTRKLLSTNEPVVIPPACCNYKDTTWFANQHYSEYRTNMESTSCPLDPPNDFSNKSCLSVVQEQLALHKMPIIVTGVIILLAELIAFALAVYLIRMIRRWYDELFY